MLKRAYDLGINFYETADMYGKGKSEKLIAQAFKDMRNEVIYSTKWGYDMYRSNRWGTTNCRKITTRISAVCSSKSLDRLQTDYIDIYSLHNPKMDAIRNDGVYLPRLMTLQRGNDKKSRGGSRSSHRVEG